MQHCHDDDSLASGDVVNAIGKAGNQCAVDIFMDIFVLIGVSGDTEQRGLDAEQKVSAEAIPTGLVVEECLREIGFGF